MLNTAERRKWAEDLIKNYANTDYEQRARAHAARLIAQADIEDIEQDIEPAIAAHAEIIQHVPICGNIHIQGGKRVRIEHPYDATLVSVIESKYGIFTAWEWADDPSAEMECGKLIRLYIGSRDKGPLAQWDAHNNIWYELTSRGNYGKRYACGGNWQAKKLNQDETPEIYQKLEEIIMLEREKEEKIARAKAKLATANKRVLAAHQRSYAAAYERQALHPAYAGQDLICMDKANVQAAIAARTEAEADLIEAIGIE